jgi:hypothetical protein
MSIEIVGYAQRHAIAFAELNYQWIEQYFAIEPRRPPRAR